jgi:adenosine deaminase
MRQKLPEEALLKCDGLPFGGAYLEDLQQIPKLDLHRHLTGAVRPEVLVGEAERFGFAIPTYGYDLEKIKRSLVLNTPLGEGGYSTFLNKRVWGAFRELFNHQWGCANAIYAAIKDASKDNVVYIEFRVAPYWVDPNNPKRFKSYILALREGIVAAAKKYPNTTTKILISVTRRSIIEKWKEAPLEAYYDNLVEVASEFRDLIVGFDLAGNEDEHPNKSFVPFAQKIKSGGFKLTVHAGETGNAENIWEALELLGADRIGHGIAAQSDPSLISHLVAANIPLEVCPTSNWFLGVVPSLSRHPFKELFHAGVKTTINTDDPVLFAGTTLSQEYWRMLACGQFSVSDIAKLQQYSIEASFASEEEKQALTKCVSQTYSDSYASAAVS